MTMHDSPPLLRCGSALRVTAVVYILYDVFPSTEETVMK